MLLSLQEVTGATPVRAVVNRSLGQWATLGASRVLRPRAGPALTLYDRCAATGAPSPRSPVRHTGDKSIRADCALKRSDNNGSRRLLHNYLRGAFERVRAPVPSGISKRFCRYISQDVCPYNVKFAQELNEPVFAPREALAGKDALTLARDLLAMTQEEFSAAFKNSPMKRAKLRGLKRNAAVVLGNLGANENVDVLTQALDDPELVRDHAASALARTGKAARACPRRTGSADSASALVTRGSPRLKMVSLARTHRSSPPFAT
jgi:hypothetical protein